ncbi:hypothetical protein AB0465_11275 [Streptomyces griseoviridis]|uniref:hypothetical protein n=1 Tax=Streptomyces griseoviridis TaxID=45398 RepID=UPI00344F294C
MSDEFVYRNENTGDVVRYPHRDTRLEMLPNWVTLREPEPEPEPPHAPPTLATPATPAPSEPDEQSPATEPQKAGGGPDAIKRPPRSASKADWQAYARTRAQDSEEETAIEGLTRDQLAEQYGGDS